jgi:hypothetical protein
VVGCVVLDGEAIFLSMAGYLDTGFHSQRFVNGGAVDRDAGRRGKQLWLGLGRLWRLAALTNPALISVLPVTMAYARLTIVSGGCQQTHFWGQWDL